MNLKDKISLGKKSQIVADIERRNDSVSVWLFFRRCIKDIQQ